MITIFNGRERSIEGGKASIWAQIDVAMREKIYLFHNGGNLNPFAIFLTVALHADADGWAFPGTKKLMEETGLSTEEAISAGLKFLRGMKLDGKRVMDHYRVMRPNGQWGRSYYHVFPESGGADKAPQVDGKLVKWDGLKPPPGDPGVGDPGMGDPVLIKDTQNPEVEPTPCPSAKSAEGHSDSTVELVNLSPHTYHMPEGLSVRKQKEHTQPCMERCGGHLGIADDTCPQCGWPAVWKGSPVYDARLKKERQDAEAKQDPILVEIGRLASLHFPQSGALNLHGLKVGVWHKRVEYHDEDGQGLLALAQRMAKGKFNSAEAYLAVVRNTYNLYGPDLPQASPHHLDSPFSDKDAETANIL